MQASVGAFKDRITLQNSEVRWAILVALLTATVARMIAPSIGSTIPPRPDGAFGATESAFRLATNSGNVIFMACALIGGALADLFDRRRVFLLGIAALIVANFLAIVTPSFSLFVSGFMLAGIGGAVTGGLVTALIRISFSEDERPIAVGWYVAAAGAGYLVGQAVVFLTDHALSWRFAYVPPMLISILAFKLAWDAVPSTHATGVGRFYEVIGISAWSLVILALAIGVISYITGERADRYTYLSFGVGIIGAIGMALVELREMRPSVRRTFREHGIIGPPRATIAAVILAGLTLSFGFYGTITHFLGYSTSIQGLSSLEAAIRLVPMGVAILFASLLTADNFDDLTVRNRTTIGFVALALGIAGLMFANPDGAYWPLIVPLLLIGVGYSISSTGITTVLLNSIPADLAGVSSGVSLASSQVGKTLGTVWLGILLIFAGGRSYSNKLEAAGMPPETVDTVVETTDTIIRNHQLGESDFVAYVDSLAQIDTASLYLDAYTSGMRWTLLIAALVSLLGGLIVWYGPRDHAAARRQDLESMPTLEEVAQLTENQDESQP